MKEKSYIMEGKGNEFMNIWLLVVILGFSVLIVLKLLGF